MDSESIWIDPNNMPSDDSSEEKKSIAESQLKGNTLRVYVYLVSHKKCGVREIQRALHFSSSSLAQYHLAKLVDIGLLKENGGEYFLTEQVKVDVLKDFLQLGTFIVPRFVFYAVFFSIVTGFLGYVLLIQSASTIEYLFEGLLVLASILFWYEALRAWTRGPA
jgi:predicted DNA-binding transcriptional regulator